MNPVELVVDKLKRHPRVTYKLIDDGIHIDPPNPDGFAVCLVNDDPEWIVHAGDQGAHWHFQDPEEALDLIAFCLSEECRLKIEERTFQIRSTLEERTDSGWAMAWQFRVFMIRLWKARTVVTFYNKLLPATGQDTIGA